MNPDVKVKWLEALRSGEYEQGTNYLRSEDDKYCCLGVLCDLAVREGVIDEPVADTAGASGAYFYDHTGMAGLPASVQRWSGVDTLGTLPGHRRDLASINDSGGTFDEIADIIEKEL